MFLLSSVRRPPFCLCKRKLRTAENCKTHGFVFIAKSNENKNSDTTLTALQLFFPFLCCLFLSFCLCAPWTTSMSCPRSTFKSNAVGVECAAAVLSGGLGRAFCPAWRGGGRGWQAGRGRQGAFPRPRMHLRVERSRGGGPYHRYALCQDSVARGTPIRVHTPRPGRGSRSTRRGPPCLGPRQSSAGTRHAAGFVAHRRYAFPVSRHPYLGCRRGS